MLHYNSVTQATKDVTCVSQIFEFFMASSQCEMQLQFSPSSELYKAYTTKLLKIICVFRRLEIYFINVLV